MLQILILSLINLEILSNQIYPKTDQLLLQLENDGWIDCENKNLIQATTCSGDDIQWLECYLVPENGLCSKQNIEISNDEIVNFLFTFYEPTFETYDIDINNNKNRGKIQIQNDLGRATIQIQSSKSSIKINQKGAYFTGLTISKECNPNCQTCDNGFCTQCNDKHYLYNYICQSDSCDLSIINQNFLTSTTGAIENGQYVITIKYNFNIAFCLVPKIYYTKGLKDSSIFMILERNQIQYTQTSQSPDSLKIYLPLNQVQTKCQQITTTSTYIYQCYIGVALTSSKITQFMAILIGQIFVERGTQSISQYTQTIPIPDSLDVEVGPVFVISETVSQNLNADQNKLTIVQTISDPELSNFQINFKEAYVIQNQNTYNLTLNYILQKGVSTTFEFIWKDGLFDPYSEFQFFINSEAKPAIDETRRRQLETSIKREQLSVIYQVKDSKTFNINKQSKKTDGVSDEIIFAIALGGILGLSFFIFLSQILYKKIKNSKNQESFHTKVGS
ncbi:unnamed protein product [Paramecium sonneborni]|uniref:Transmembrane protein n=1 Tax=Paramecium sonneborni TaxID=65129 RepID=A0A8S1QQX9_9CILI|nr:unnamed protein product [Paramecium sonneborni]